MKELQGAELDLKQSKKREKELMKSFIEYGDARQIIIVENDIPEIDYSKVNRIEFTKRQDKGRYGFID